MGEVLPTRTLNEPAEDGQSCRCCGAALRHTFVDLGMSPLCESFRAREDLDTMEAHFPLHTYVCDACWLVQLRQYVSPEHIFSEYAYFSSYSTTWVAHAKTYVEMIAERLDLRAGSLVVELASNDGYLLQHFLPLGIPVLGIEPAANVASVAQDKGVETLVAFFGEDLAARLAADGRSADLIAANNVLAQVPDLNSFVAGVAKLLKPQGVATIEVPHLQRLIEDNQYDTIYHEHFSYFSLMTMQTLGARHGLRVIDVETLSTHGGSLRVYFARDASRHPTTVEVGRVLDAEAAFGLGKLATYQAFAERVARTKRNLLSFLIAAKNDDKKICGYGAPGKGNTLLNYCGIGPDILDFTVDRNPYKHGRYTPGRLIPILDVAAISEARPDYVLILPWNLQGEIVAQMRHIADWGGKFVVPIPEVQVIDPKDLNP